MKQITQEQINSVMNVFFELNVPIKSYVAVKDLFDKLPVVKEKEDDKKTKNN